MDKIYCDYKFCDKHPGNGECDMVGVYIDENGKCGKMFPATPRHLSSTSTRPDKAEAVLCPDCGKPNCKDYSHLRFKSGG